MSNLTDVSRVNNDLPYRAMLMGRIVKWIDKISTPEFREFKRRQIRYALADDFEHELGLVETYEDFDFDDPIDKQHKLIMSFLYLSQTIETLSQIEYYFRRYPFSKSPVSREDHARNMCEFYLGQFYIIEARIKTVLNNLKAIGLSRNINTGKIIKEFQKEFKQELRRRNGVVHHEPFEGQYYTCGTHSGLLY